MMDRSGVKLDEFSSSKVWLSSSMILRCEGGARFFCV